MKPNYGASRSAPNLPRPKDVIFPWLYPVRLEPIRQTQTPTYSYSQIAQSFYHYRRYNIYFIF